MAEQNNNNSSNVTVCKPDLDEMVRDNIAWMLGLATRISGDRSLADDIVQEAFINAFKGLDKFEGRSSLKTWLHRITVNAALTKLRQLDRLSEQPIDELLPTFNDSGCRIEPAWSKILDVTEIIENEQLKAIVRDKIYQLPDSLRIVLYLRDIEGYSTTEVAEMLELTESNAKVRLHRARAGLKKLLEPLLRNEVEI